MRRGSLWAAPSSFVRPTVVLPASEVFIRLEVQPSARFPPEISVDAQQTPVVATILFGSLEGVMPSRRVSVAELAASPAVLAIAVARISWGQLRWTS